MSSTGRVFLGLGSNLGDKKANLEKAISELGRAGVKTARKSSFYNTRGIGPVNQPNFLNACIEVSTKLSPEKLLKLVKRIEKDCGRITIERWGPRILDIDILLYDALEFDSPELTIPHPFLNSRDFVLVPLRELDPNLLYPGRDVTVSQLLDELIAGGTESTILSVESEGAEDSQE
jgi:2-amino-4-hydroxy-6-hydroxymethyldihydropteridine diphosphokinase